MSSTIHVFEKDDFSKHHLVTLPQTSNEPLGASSLRLRTRILGQTTNNLTYAKLGFAVGWWDIYPIPEHAPAPYNDRSKYATIAGWGYAEVLESTVANVPIGASVFGYLYIGTGTWDVCVEKAECEGQYLVKDAYRQRLWKCYNRLSVRGPIYKSDEEKDQIIDADSLGWDALMEVLFATGYNLSTYGFAWEDSDRIHPNGEREWGAEDAELKNSVVVILNASGKTGMSFAYTLRHNRPKESQPKKIVAVGSDKSLAFLEQCGFYDEVLLNEDAEKVKELVERDTPNRVLLFNFGARPGAMASYTSTLSALQSPIPLTCFFVGGDNRPAKVENVMEELAKRGEGVQVNANTLREKGVEIGGDAYFERFDKVWNDFKNQGAIKGTNLVWGKGMVEWEKGWEALCKDEVRGDEGRVYVF
ncbi:hypothetical protein GRF29_103g690997 [Pseudopithomyces chartarum]|uniref:Uncharacterized protein n=1 Tax=Pseudopithomyces chartarum TaxID=1892770 RepID=A0AAN6RG24_9PLEO|nr:hypothetical protein GRF29_103g690997 [Pseudopithomyces chartarum]